MDYENNAPRNEKWLSESDALGHNYYCDRIDKPMVTGNTLQPNSLALSFNYLNLPSLLPSYNTPAQPSPTPSIYQHPLIMKLALLTSTLLPLVPLTLAESLQPCGTARYYPSKYTCFGTQLCPKTSTGEATITCGPACYDAGTYYCDSKTQLHLITPDSAVQYCGTAPYRPGTYTCWGGNFLCPVLNGEATLACGGTACYNPREYTCTDGKLGSPTVAPAPTCNGLYGE